MLISVTLTDSQDELAKQTGGRGINGMSKRPQHIRIIGLSVPNTCPNGLYPALGPRCRGIVEVESRHIPGTEIYGSGILD